jgi:phage protein D
MAITYGFEIEPGGAERSQQLISLRLLETIRGCAHYKMHFRSLNWTDWNDLVDPKLRLKIKVGVSDNLSDQKTLMVNSYDFEFLSEGMNVFLEGFDGGYVMEEKSGQRFFRDKLISDMVKEIAGDHGLETDITATKDKFIIPQGLMHDGKFISDFCLPRAYTADRTDYFFFIKNGTKVVFRPLKESDKAHRTINFAGGEFGGEVEKMVVSSKRVMMAPHLSLSTKMLGWHPRKKQLVEKTADDDEVSYPELGNRKPTAPSFPARVMSSTAPFDLITPDESQVKSMGDAAFQRYANEFYVTTIVLNPGDAKFFPGSVLNLDISSANSETHYETGSYWVYGVEHIIEGGSYKTKLTLVRRGSRAGG